MTKNHLNPNEIYGKRFSQESLKRNLQGVIAGQHIALKYLLVTFLIILATLSGCLTGMFGGIVSLSIFYIRDQPEIPLTYFCITFVVIAWMFITVRYGLAKGLRGSIFIGVPVSILLAVRFGDPAYILYMLFFSLPAMGAAFLSLLAGSLSFSLISILFYRNQQFIRTSCALFITAISIAVASLMKINDPVKNLFFPDYVTTELVKLLGGLLSGIVVAWASLSVTRFEGKRSENFAFLRNWSIALGSWGATSFYNLDLSNVNFRNAKLGNTDLRAKKLYRTCFQDVEGLERARVDSRYLDLENPKVQKLITHGCSEDKDFSRINLQGAYLQDADIREFRLIETNLTGANLRKAKLQDSILVRAQVTGVDFTEANLTGICIQDWSVNSETCFAGVECDYVYRKLDENGERTDRYPIEGKFEPGEFESLFQEVSNVVELIFKEGIDWRALSFTFRKFQLEDDGLDLELKGVEQRGDLWVVKVSHKEGVPKQHVEQRVNEIYDDIKSLLAVKEQQINRLLNIAENQAEAVKEFSKRPLGNSNIFFIVGSTITNLAGSGEIDYDEASSKIRSIVANGGDPSQVAPVVHSLLEQFQSQSVATTLEEQAELLLQIILAEAKSKPDFQQLFIGQGEQIADAMPESAIAAAIKKASAQLTNN